MIRKPRTSLTTGLLLCALSLLFPLGATALAQNGLPPLIDREVLLGNPEIARAQISPDGMFIAFLKPHKDTLNIWVKRADEPFANARLLTNEPKRPIRNYFWSRDGKFILFVNDKGGNENFNLYALRDRGFPVEYIVAPDEGHGFQRPVNRIAMLAQTEKFLAKYLGGRYQESLTPEVAKRLQEITVDPKAVKLAANPNGK